MAAMASNVLWHLASVHQATKRVALTRCEVTADVMQQSKAHLKEKVLHDYRYSSSVAGCSE